MTRKMPTVAVDPCSINCRTGRICLVSTPSTRVATVCRPNYTSSNVRTPVELLTNGSCCSRGILGRVRRSVDSDTLDCDGGTSTSCGSTCRAGRRRRRTLLDQRRPKRRAQPSGTAEPRPLEEVLHHARTEHRQRMRTVGKRMVSSLQSGRRRCCSEAGYPISTCTKYRGENDS